MKSRNLILSLSSAFIGLIFLAGSTGITLIIHNCPVCDKHTVSAGIYLSPEEPEDNCCEAADMHCTSEGNISMESSCCHFTIEKLRITNYAPVIPLLLSALAEIPYTTDLLNNQAIHHSISVPVNLHNKHGGRYLLSFNCQLIS
ncbi:MAG: hypothetical protein V1903_02325 [Bacteroidota bacterium]